MFRDMASLRWDDIPIVAIDTETSGFSRKDSIIEISCIMLLGNEVLDEYTTLVGDVRHVSDEITDITGITNEMLADAPMWSEIEENVLDFLLRGAPWVAHNMSFDARMLRCHITNWPMGVPTLCTKIAGRRLVGSKVQSHSLKPLCEHYKIKIEGWHRARGDALACGQLARCLTKGQLVADLVTRPSEAWS